jgi:hypothetical protein
MLGPWKEYLICYLQLHLDCLYYNDAWTTSMIHSAAYRPIVEVVLFHLSGVKPCFIISG